MTNKFNVGSKVVAVRGCNYVRKGDHGVVVSKCHDGYWVQWDNPLQTCSDNCWHIVPENIQLLATSVQKFPLTNTKINVQKYADDNGLTLAAAHKEVQEWLFGQGYKWVGAKTTYAATTWEYIFLDSHINGDITQTPCEDAFNIHRNKEITLQRTVAVTLTPSFVEPVPKDSPEVLEYVEIGGEKYEKAWLETVVGAVVEAQRKLKSMEETK